jgi:hypothetical protein
MSMFFNNYLVTEYPWRSLTTHFWSSLEHWDRWNKVK